MTTKVDKCPINAYKRVMGLESHFVMCLLMKLTQLKAGSFMFCYWFRTGQFYLFGNRFRHFSRDLRWVSLIFHRSSESELTFLMRSETRAVGFVGTTILQCPKFIVTSRGYLSYNVFKLNHYLLSYTYGIWLTWYESYIMSRTRKL